MKLEIRGKAGRRALTGKDLEVFLGGVNISDGLKALDLRLRGSDLNTVLIDDAEAFCALEALVEKRRERG